VCTVPTFMLTSISLPSAAEGRSTSGIRGTRVTYFGMTWRRMLRISLWSLPALWTAIVLTGCVKSQAIAIVPSPPPPPIPVPQTHPRACVGCDGAAYPPDVPSAPPFPWPPPAASARTVLPPLFLQYSSPTRTLGDIDALLSSALDATGYGEKGYYSVPGGFALATRLEQISSDGRSIPPPDRFSPSAVVPKFWSIDYLKALFTAASGHFRVIVFVVTDQAFTEGPTPPSQDTAQNWPNGGTNILPPAIASAKQSKYVAVTALIYEFESANDVGSRQLKLLIPGGLDATIHLRMSGLWSALRLQ
jgi:hypothetical protein